MSISTTLTVNGVKRTIELDDPRLTLLDFLREHLHLTGTKKGCDRGSAALARSSSRGDGSIRALRLRSVTTALTSSRSKVWHAAIGFIRCKRRFLHTMACSAGSVPLARS